jgi:hypothetical protein
MDVCLENPSLVTIGQKYRTIYWRTYARFFVAGEMFPRKIIVARDSVFLDCWQWRVAQSCTYNAVFPLQQCLREGTSMLGFTYIAYLLQVIKPQSFSHRFQPLYGKPNTVKHVNLTTFVTRPLFTSGHTSTKQKFVWHFICLLFDNLAICCYLELWPQF